MNGKGTIRHQRSRPLPQSCLSADDPGGSPKDTANRRHARHEPSLLETIMKNKNYFKLSLKITREFASAFSRDGRDVSKLSERRQNEV
jgi:hypothetical protein